MGGAVKDPYLLQMPRNRAAPADYMLESSTKDVHRYSTLALRQLVRELGDAAILLEQASACVSTGLGTTSHFRATRFWAQSIRGFGWHPRPGWAGPGVSVAR